MKESNVLGIAPLFAVGGRTHASRGEQQSAAWGGGELPTLRGNVETFDEFEIKKKNKS